MREHSCTVWQHPFQYILKWKRMSIAVAKVCRLTYRILSRWRQISVIKPRRAQVIVWVTGSPIQSTFPHLVLPSITRLHNANNKEDWFTGEQCVVLVSKYCSWKGERPWSHMVNRASIAFKVEVTGLPKARNRTCMGKLSGSTQTISFIESLD